MDIKSLIIGKSSENGKSVATKLSNRLKHIEKLVSDSDVKSVIKSLEGSLDIKPKYPGLRMDAIIDGIGIVCVMGNMQAIGTRCFSSLYYKNKGVINEQIFVSHSPANAWQHEYKDGKTCKPSNGNRITSIDLRKMIDEIYPGLLDIPITILSLEDSTSKIEYKRYFDSIGRESQEFP